MNRPLVRLTVAGADRGRTRDIVAELFPDKAPETVRNFLTLVRSGFYDGLIFHRVVRGLLIQGGGFTPSFEERRAAPIRGEFIGNGCMGNDLRHERGTLSMARTDDPDSASSQFLILCEDAPSLDARYAAFGRVTAGMDAVDRIAAAPAGRRGCRTGVPNTCIRILRAAEIRPEDG